MNKLYELQVRVAGPFDDDPDHLEITVEMVCEGQDVDCSEKEYRLASLSHAGTLGRLAVHAVPWMLLEHAQHHCDAEVQPSDHGGLPLASGCHVTTGSLLVDPDADLRPRVFFYVPRKRRAWWLTQIATWLSGIEGFTLLADTASESSEW